MSNQVPPNLTRRGFAAIALAMAATLSLTLPHSAQAQEATTDTVSGPELIMVEQAGCEWCKRWNEEIGPIYPKTREGDFAPLRRVDLRAIPDDITVLRRVSFTPTFLIVQDGHEVARLEGYPGEDFFWPLIAKLMSKHLGFLPEGA